MGDETWRATIVFWVSTSFGSKLPTKSSTIQSPNFLCELCVLCR
jgi:hypothetical protein